MISRVIRLLAAIVLPLALAACATGPKAAPGDLGRQFTATIPGTWESQLRENGMSIHIVKQYRRDGTAGGVAMIKRTGGGVSVVMPEIPFTSRWRVKGDVVETYDVKSGIPGLFKPGTVIRDTIVSVSPKRIVSRSEKTGSVEVQTRLNSLH